MTPTRAWRPNSAWYAFCRGCAHNLFFRPLGGVRAINESNVPGTGPVILAPIHLSNLDPPAVACATRRHLRFMAKEELFKGWFGKLIFSVGAFPVRRGSTDTDSIRNALAFLEDGQALLLFPEGSRGDARQLGQINKGISMLAKRGDIPVVPAAIIGSHLMLPKGAKKLRRGGIVIEFGTPFRYSEVGSKEAFVATLEARLIELANKNGLPLRASASDQPSEMSSDLA